MGNHGPIWFVIQFVAVNVIASREKSRTLKPPAAPREYKQECNKHIKPIGKEMGKAEEVGGGLILTCKLGW